jgi:hypothetical protein
MLLFCGCGIRELNYSEFGFQEIVTYVGKNPGPDLDKIKN